MREDKEGNAGSGRRGCRKEVERRRKMRVMMRDQRRHSPNVQRQAPCQAKALKLCKATSMFGFRSGDRIACADDLSRHIISCHLTSCL